MEKYTGQDTIFFVEEGCYFRNKYGRARATFYAMNMELVHSLVQIMLCNCITSTGLCRRSLLRQIQGKLSLIIHIKYLNYLNSRNNYSSNFFSR